VRKEKNQTEKINRPATEPKSGAAKKIQSSTGTTGVLLGSNLKHRRTRKQGTLDLEA
jgi:hypothetical protein